MSELPRFSVLFVCTANIARSPYAEHRARQLLGDASVTVASAGVLAKSGNDMDVNMAAELESRGGSGDGHASRRVDETLVLDADLVLTFEFRHQMMLLEEFGEHSVKIAGFNQFATALRSLPDHVWSGGRVERVLGELPMASMIHDVEDPYGRGPKAAARCAAEIDSGLELLVAFLTGEPRPDAPPVERGRRRLWWRP